MGKYVDGILHVAGIAVVEGLLLINAFVIVGILWVFISSTKKYSQVSLASCAHAKPWSRFKLLKRPVSLHQRRPTSTPPGRYLDHRHHIEVC